MVSDHIRKHMAIQPFRPFHLNLADGRRLRVAHPEFIYVPPKNERTIFVTHNDGEVEIVDVLLVVSLLPVGKRRGGNGADAHGSNGSGKPKRRS